MKLIKNITLAFLLSLVLIPKTFAAIELTDDNDLVVRLDHPAARIISENETSKPPIPKEIAASIRNIFIDIIKN